MEVEAINNFEALIEWVPWLKIAGTFLLFAVLSIIRFLLSAAIRGKKEYITKSQRIWITRIKNIYWLFLFIGAILIWAPQLQTIALSLAAVAVAIVIATKEMILCIVGSFVRVSARPFELGDWVKIDNVIVGEVVNSNLFSFEIQEFDTIHGTYEYTGRYHIIPNSKVLTSNISNENIFKAMVALEFSIVIEKPKLDAEELSRRLDAILAEETEAFHDHIKQLMRNEKRKTGLALQDAVYLYGLETTEFAYFQFWVRVFVPVKKALDVKNRIMTRFLKDAGAHNVEIDPDIEEKEDTQNETTTSSFI